VLQAAVRLEGHVGRVYEALQHLHALAAEAHGDDGVGVTVALQQGHVPVGAARRRLATPEIRINTRL